MKGHKIIIVLTVLMISAARLAAQSDTLTVEQAVELALKNNYDILIAKNDADIAARNNTIGNAGMLPTVNGTVSDNFTYNHLDQKFSNSTTPDINRNGVQGNTIGAAVNLNWTLFDGLKMFATKGKLKALEDIGELNYKDQVQNTIAQVIVAYYNVVGAQQQVNAINEAIRISDERVKLAEAKFQVGSSSKVDYLQAKVDLNEQKSNLLNQRTVIEQRKAELNTLLVRPTETDFNVTDSINITYNPTANPADIENKNFALAAAMRNIDVAKYSKKEVFSQFLPNLKALAGYGFTRTQSNAGFTLYNQTYGPNVGFSLNIPLFNGLNTIRQYKVASIEILSSQFGFEKARNQTRLNYYVALRNFANAKELLDLEQENIQLADENQQIALERFRLAQSTAIELREAQQSYVNAQVRLVNARLSAKAAETELLRLQGELVK